MVLLKKEKRYFSKIVGTFLLISVIFNKLLLEDNAISKEDFGRTIKTRNSFTCSTANFDQQDFQAGLWKFISPVIQSDVFPHGTSNPLFSTRSFPYRAKRSKFTVFLKKGTLRLLSSKVQVMNSKESSSLSPLKMRLKEKVLNRNWIALGISKLLKVAPLMATFCDQDHLHCPVAGGVLAGDHRGSFEEPRLLHLCPRTFLASNRSLLDSK
uniref:uncharacterized protein LOC117608985 n=1 Tax=Osmia lignaria TaxID=473952 RepID=UPI001478B432|nr:uncharacterized protein LOC117608985 [Osmia lignaria]